MEDSLMLVVVVFLALVRSEADDAVDVVAVQVHLVLVQENLVD